MIQRVSRKAGSVLQMFACFGFSFFLTGLVWAEGEQLSASQKHGQKVYEQNCSGCHGVDGHGDGPASSYLYPRPRDFSKGLFKLSSTPTGNLPTDQDIFDAITGGMPGSAMPSWELLKSSDRWAVVEHVKYLTKAWNEDDEVWVNLFQVRGQVDAIKIPARPAATPESLARGKLLYRKAECWKCHGDGGHGDGPSAPTLKDSWDQPIRPRDFTAGIFKGGNRPESLFKRITVGMPGTPMPAHDTFLESDRWDLANYIRSLIRPGAQELTVQVRKTIPVPAIEGDVPATPDDKKWDSIQPVYVSLMPLWWRDIRVEGVLIRVVHNRKDIAVHLSWEDIRQDNRTLRMEQFADGAAVQFALSEDAPFIAMGGIGGNVNIWFWRGDREAPAELEDEYPGYVNDAYEVTTLNGGKKPETKYFVERTPTAKLSPLFFPAWSAGNWISDPQRETPVDDLNARGFGTLAMQAKANQNVLAKALWEKGVWRCVFRRPMASPQKEDIQFQPGGHMPVAFAIWDGSERDRNGQKSITIWHDLELQW